MIKPEMKFGSNKVLMLRSYRNQVPMMNASVWIRCPACSGKTRTKVYADTVLVKFPLFCPKCKKESCIDVVKLKMVVS